MDAIVALERLSEADRERAGDKACRLARIAASGFEVAPALCVTTAAYQTFVDANHLRDVIRMELARKPFEDMRWEEIWDAGLRIRGRFLRSPLPEALRRALADAVEERFRGVPVVVRSSAPGEDGRGASFAGLHDSFVNVQGTEEILRHIPMVWASLWSDRGLLYRRELALDVDASSMAVIVQALVRGERSGVAFSRHPSEPDQSAVEAVYGLNQGLVDGTIEPDRWVVDRASGQVVEHRPPPERRSLVAAPGGAALIEATPENGQEPPLDTQELTRVLEAARRLEALFQSPQDVEWTIAGDRLVILQARPVTAATHAEDGDQRPWYLSLHRSFASLRGLRRTVEEERLPALDAEARALAGVELESLSDGELGAEIDRRIAVHERWVDVYWSEFIPLAHGIRMFGQVYNDVVRPADPYQFMDLLVDSGLLSVRRNQRLEELAARLRSEPGLAAAVREGGVEAADRGFTAELQSFLDEFGTMAFGDAQCFAERGRLLRLLLELASRPAPAGRPAGGDRADLTAAFLDRVNPEERAQARELLELARSSYRLRDDDNLHLGAIRAEVLRAAAEGHARLVRLGHAPGLALDEAQLVRALRDPNLRVEAPPRQSAPEPEPGFSVRPRQLVGQPAAPGVATGPARVLGAADSLFEVTAGDVIVCDAIDPNMTFVVPLASAVVERRGGMLIHGAIIAREYGLPCVTGIAGATTKIATGDRLTVDGFLGIVTVG
jgi:pyruvate,water dikinase